MAIVPIDFNHWNFFSAILLGMPYWSETLEGDLKKI
jgi:hypothetical protein